MESAKLKKTKLVVIVEGGTVQNIFTDNNHCDVLVIDYDTQGADPEDIYQIVSEFENLADATIDQKDDAYVYRMDGYEDLPYVQSRFNEIESLEKAKETL